MSWYQATDPRGGGEPAQTTLPVPRHFAPICTSEDMWWGGASLDFVFELNLLNSGNKTYSALRQWQLLLPLFEYQRKTSLFFVTQSEIVQLGYYSVSVAYTLLLGVTTSM